MALQAASTFVQSITWMSREHIENCGNAVADKFDAGGAMNEIEFVGGKILPDYRARKSLRTRIQRTAPATIPVEPVRKDASARSRALA